MTAIARLLSSRSAAPPARSQTLSAKQPALALLYQQQHLYALWLSAAKHGYNCRFYQQLAAEPNTDQQPLAPLLTRMAVLLKQQFKCLPPAMLGLDEQHYQQQQLTLQARPAPAQQVQEHLQQQLASTPDSAPTSVTPAVAQHYRVDYQAEQGQCQLAVAHEQPVRQLEQHFNRLKWPLAVIEPSQQSRLRGLCYYLPQCWAQLAGQQLPADWCLLCNASFGLLQCYRGSAAQWQQHQLLPLSEAIAELRAQPASLCLLDAGIKQREQLYPALADKMPVIALDDVAAADIAGLPSAIDCQLLGLALRGFYSCHI